MPPEDYYKRKFNKIVESYLVLMSDLDKVKNLLEIHAEQVFGETESYEQFKYELTLRAVEAVINQDHNLGWDELPEEEEIKFVTDVANLFEDTIKSLYKYYMR